MSPSRFVKASAIFLFHVAALGGCSEDRETPEATKDGGPPLSHDEGSITRDGGPFDDDMGSDAASGAGQPCDEPLGVRTRFATSTVPYGESCVDEVQARSCTHGVWGEWNGKNTFEHCSVAPPAECDGAPHASVQARIRYAEARVSYDAQCRPESQVRRCENGTWTPWSGDHAEQECEPEVPGACDGQPHGSVEARVRYAASEVAEGQLCQAETQTRSCHNGTWTSWTGTLEAMSCKAQGADCDGGSHGETQAQIRYAEAQVRFGAQCAAEAQTRRCDNGTWTPWTGSFEASECASEPGASCYGTPHGGQIARVRYALAAPVQGGVCEAEVQTRSCVDGQWADWTGNYEHGLCGIQSRVDSCDTTPSGGMETRVRYAKARVSGADTCAYEVQQRKCEAGTFGKWTGSFAELACVPEHKNDPCSAGYDACGVCGGPGPKRMYADADGDGFGDPAAEHILCPTSDTVGLVQNATDLTPKCFTRRGNVRLETEADILAMQGVCEADGDLQLAFDDSITSLALHSLTRVTGKIALVPCEGFTCPLNTNLQTLDFASLREAGGIAVAGRKKLSTVRMPVLEKISGDLLLGDCGGGGMCYGNPALWRVEFPVLAEVGGRLSLSLLPAFAGQAFPRLVQVGTLELQYMDTRRVDMFPSLKRAEKVLVSGSSAVASIEFYALEQVNVLSLSELSSLSTLSFPKLTQVASLRLGPLGMRRVSCSEAFPNVKFARLLSLSLHSGPKNEEIRCDGVQQATRVYISNDAGAITFSLAGLTDAEEVTLYADRPTALNVANLKRVGELSLSASYIDVWAPELETVSKNLYLNGSGSTEPLRFEKLAEVLGDVTVNSDAPRLEMPALRYVKGSVTLSMLMAKSVLLGRLMHVDKALLIERVSALVELDVAKLERVGGVFRLANTQLTQLSLPALSHIELDFELSNNAVINGVQAPVLQHARRVAFSVNPALPACVATGLAARLGVTCACASNGPGTCD